MTFWSPVSCFEVVGTRNEDYSFDGINCSVTLQVSNANKNSLINDLLLNEREWPDAFLTNPPTVKKCAATPLVPDGLQDAQAYAWSEWQVQVSYSTEEAQDLVAESLSIDAEFLRLDHRFFRWGSDSSPLSPGEAPGLLQPKLKLSRQFFKRTSIPAALLLAGHTHNASYTSPTFGLTFASGTLMLVPGESSTKKTSGGGTVLFDYAADFIYNSNGWNKFLRLDTGAYDQIINPAGSVVTPYPLSNLLALLV